MESQGGGVDVRLWDQDGTWYATPKPIFAVTGEGCLVRSVVSRIIYVGDEGTSSALGGLDVDSENISEGFEVLEEGILGDGSLWGWWDV